MNHAEFFKMHATVALFDLAVLFSGIAGIAAFQGKLVVATVFAGLAGYAFRAFYVCIPGSLSTAIA
jgi:arginine exporter protein ArgO